MGQAAVDLPDPLHPTDAEAHAGPGDGGASADDLLSQLAGEEIDRLLAEADAGDARAPLTLPGTFESQRPPESLQQSSATNDAASADVQQPHRRTAAIHQTAAPGTRISPAEPAADRSEFASAAEESAALLSEIDEYNASPHPFAPRTSAPQVEPDDAAHSNGREPFYVRILELINAPFNSVSDETRESVGRIAILTLFNSIVVIAYILIFRRHG